MLKLIKYEFRKTLTTLLVLLATTVALEAYYLVSLHLREEMHTAMSVGLLAGCAYAVMIYVFIRGITTYSNELKDRSAYLIFMTPNSGLKIMGSKFLYTFVNGLAFFVLYAALAGVDVMLLMKMTGEEISLEMIGDGINSVLAEAGVGLRLDQILLAVLVFVLYGVLSILSFMALTYLAVTLSHTLFRDKKWRGIASVGIFAGLNWLVGQINSLLPSVYDKLEYITSSGVLTIEAQFGLQTTATLNDILIALLPSAGVSLAVILASLFGCAWMLDKKVSL